MTHNRPQRKSPRHPDANYAAEGSYFVTICTHNRAHLFGEIRDGKMNLSPAGEIAHKEIERVPGYWRGVVDVDTFVVMPNHVHMIVVLVGVADAENGVRHPTNPRVVGTAFLPSAPKTPPSVTSPPDNANSQTAPTLGTIVGSYKSGVTRRIHRQINQPHLTVWQSRYHDHIIRNIDDYHRIRAYVLTNPTRWEKDTFYAS
jgi:putative transposase